jgi:hypothetical protein
VGGRARRRRCLQRAAPWVVVLIAVVLPFGCGGPADRGVGTGTAATEKSLPKGRGWEMVSTRDDYVELDAGYDYLDIYCVVRLSDQRPYGDNELLSIAKAVVEPTRKRRVSKVDITFVVNEPSRLVGMRNVGEAIWSVRGEKYPDGLNRRGDYSQHRFRVLSNVWVPRTSGP